MATETQKERAAVIEFLRSQILEDPCGDAEEHWNDCLRGTIRDISNGVHVKAVRSNG